jgi:hypothetical protein
MRGRSARRSESFSGACHEPSIIVFDGNETLLDLLPIAGCSPSPTLWISPEPGSRPSPSAPWWDPSNVSRLRQPAAASSPPSAVQNPALLGDQRQSPIWSRRSRAAYLRHVGVSTRRRGLHRDGHDSVIPPWMTISAPTTYELALEVEDRPRRAARRRPTLYAGRFHQNEVLLNEAHHRYQRVA